MNFSQYDNLEILKKLAKPTDKVHIVLDTDAFNEIDDQYAITYALKKQDRIIVDAIYAAPFFNRQSTSPKDGMEKSYNEIKKLLTILKREDMNDNVFKGSENYLIDEATPQVSDAALDLVKRAKSLKANEFIYVVSIGAITNIASAILMYPEIVNKIVIVWLGGHAHYWNNTREFNMFQDVAASRIVFNCRVPLVQIPCMGVASHLIVGGSELYEHLADKSEIGDYLYDITYKIGTRKPHKVWSRVIWDISTVIWLAGPDNCMTDHLESSPIISYEGNYSFDSTRHLIRVVDSINRDAVFEELFNVINS